MKEENTLMTAFFDESKFTVGIPECLYEMEIKPELHAPHEVLIANGENFIFILDKMVKHFPGAKFTVAFRNTEILEALEKKNTFKNLTLSNYDIFEPVGHSKKYDLILAFPPINPKEMTEYAETETLLSMLTPIGRFISLYSYGTTFRKDQKTKEFRDYIINNYKIERIISLPSGLLNFSAVQTVMLKIEKGKTNKVALYSYNHSRRERTCRRINECVVSVDKIREKETWDINLLTIDNDPDIKNYMASSIAKTTLVEIAEIYRGKSLGRTDGEEENGNIGIINISDIKDSGIAFDQIRWIKDDRRKYLNFELADNDILLTARGTDIRTAIFKKPDDRIYIPTANLITIHPIDKTQQDALQLFFECKIGKKLIESCQKGTSMMNIVTEDIKNLVVPVFSAEQAEKISAEYEQLRENLKTSKKEAEQLVAAATKKLDDFYDTFSDSLQ